MQFTAAERNRFFFGTEIVGYFEDELPSSPGSYRYMPFRGRGHYRLGQALVSIGPQRCYYFVEGEPRYFIAEKMSTPHVLRLSA